MYIYVTCCPDIGYSICCLIKFSTCPSEFYFDVLKNATIYLKCTSRQGIYYHRESAIKHTDLPTSYFIDQPLALQVNFPSFVPD